VLNDILLRALRHENTERPPIWLLRQAGRHQSEYKKLREQEPDFIKFCQNPELTTKAALIPINKYNLDASILFSDILTVPHALGMELNFKKNIGPVFNQPINSYKEILQLQHNEAEEKLKYVGKAIRSLKIELDNKIPIIGFCGSPWTLATYMIEGKSSKTFSKAKIFALEHREYCHKLLEILTNTTIKYVDMQIKAGADVIMIFDTWGGILSEIDYKDLSLFYMTNIIKYIKENYKNKIPTILFTKGGGVWLSEIKNSGCTCISLDSSTSVNFARQQVGSDVVLQGNLDPFILHANKNVIEKRTLEILKQLTQKKNFIFNLGHGIPENANPENVKFLSDIILNFKY
jgi:uroporphyrinogen decarboxylase